MSNDNGVVYTLYGLYHPVTKELRYIGQTKFKPRRRLLGHIQDAKRGKDNGKTAVLNWIRKLLKSGLEPVQKVLYQTCSEDEINRMEIITIRGCRNRGFRLLNIYRGGSPRGHKRSEDAKKRTSETLKERYRNKAHHLKGRVLDPEHKAKIAEGVARSTANQNWTDERKRKNAEASRKRWEDPVMRATMEKRRLESRARNKALRMQVDASSLH